MIGVVVLLRAADLNVVPILTRPHVERTGWPSVRGRRNQATTRIAPGRPCGSTQFAVQIGLVRLLCLQHPPDLARLHRHIPPYPHRDPQRQPVPRPRPAGQDRRRRARCLLLLPGAACDRPPGPQDPPEHRPPPAQPDEAVRLLRPAAPGGRQSRLELLDLALRGGEGRCGLLLLLLYCSFFQLCGALPDLLLLRKHVQEVLSHVVRLPPGGVHLTLRHGLQVPVCLSRLPLAGR
mmetsp:Transcript_3005/g.7168  ORF Transcript_3005/g.7168 Transcript_3005/m.7168 type:complete len:235 (-) Transcript_3005:872-1576(-)